MLVGEGCKRVEEGIESPSSPGAKEAKEAHAGGTAFGAARAATNLARNDQLTASRNCRSRPASSGNCPACMKPGIDGRIDHEADAPRLCPAYAAACQRRAAVAGGGCEQYPPARCY